ncbi:MAG: hypothetical protein KAU14_01425 [Thermoplasmata archaeon]|nr:hypothetical protein [Thermoplasmata archaeon]
MENSLTKNPKLIAIGIAAIMILGGFIAMLALDDDSDKYPKADETIKGNNLLLVSDSSPFFALMAAPVAVYYTNESGTMERHAQPLLARTFFYYDIIDSFPGTNGFDWKESAFAHFGSEPPVESSVTVVERFKAMWTEAGFLGMDDPVAHSNEMGRRQLSQEYYERANYHFFCAHGFYYWYVPTAQESLLSEGGDIIKSTAGGGAFTTASVKDMEMGPGTIFGSSCVTGKTDGIPGRNALSMAFLHAGMNVYIGASRLSYGSLTPEPDPNSDEALGNYLGAMYYAYMSGGVFYDKETGNTHMPYEDLSSGQAPMLAKNKYVRDKGDGGVDMTTYVEFMHYGDPAFNPYEPNHNG